MPTSSHKELGGFAVKSKGTKVKVSGSGSVLVWTKRALERAGYQAVDQEVGMEIICESSGSRRKWELVIEDQTVICYSIEELIISLGEMKPL